MSRILAGVVIGFGNCEETVSICVLVQKIESPRFVIPVPGAFRSNRRIRTLATAATATLTMNRRMIRERNRSWTGVAPFATLTA